MRVLHVTPSFAPAFRYGGPIQTVLRLCQALQGAGVEVQVATTNADGPRDLDVPTDRWVDYEGVQVRYFARSIRIGFAPSTSLLTYLRAAAPRFDLVHVTSTFSFPALAAGVTARASSVPYVVSPRGSLQTWSLRQKRWKKVPYWFAYERRHLARAAAIHATASSERDELRQVLTHPRVFVVPNGAEDVQVPQVDRDPRRIVFLGRLHPKKGFDVLVPALSRLERDMPGVETVIAGPDEDGEWERIQRLVAGVDPKPRLRYLGAVAGDGRFELLASSAVFVLPSHSENFGITVLEAMSCGTPVVVSRNCPWRAIEEHGAGAWVENTPQAVSAALLEILLDPERAAAMGRAGRKLALSYAWPAIGRAMAEQYRVITDESRAPTEVP